MLHDGIPTQNGWTFSTLSFHGFDTYSNMKVEIQCAIWNMSVSHVCTFEARLLAQILHKFGIDGTFALVCLKMESDVIWYPWVRKRSITNTDHTGFRSFQWNSKNTRNLKHQPHQAWHQMQFAFNLLPTLKPHLSSIPVAHSWHCNRLSTHGFISSGPCRSKQRRSRSPRTGAMVRYLTSVPLKIPHQCTSNPLKTVRLLMVVLVIHPWQRINTRVCPFQMQCSLALM